MKLRKLLGYKQVASVILYTLATCCIIDKIKSVYSTKIFSISSKSKILIWLRE